MKTLVAVIAALSLVGCAHTQNPSRHELRVHEASRIRSCLFVHPYYSDKVGCYMAARRECIALGLEQTCGEDEIWTEQGNTSLSDAFGYTR